jgi:hypothetical protein
MPSYSLVCPFLTDDPAFTYGVEFGLLFAKMQSGAEEIKDYFCRKNQDRILLLANRLGWKVRRIKPWSKNWFWCVLQKESASTL